jgi:hypothetical protein
MELADLDRLRFHNRRALVLWVLRPVSNHARFSLGEFFALWNWGCVVDNRSVPRVWPAAGLSRKDFRLDLRSGRSACCRVFQLRNLLRPPAGAGLSWRTTRWSKGTGFHTIGSKWKTCRPRRFASNSRGAVLIFYRGFW